MAAQAVFNQVMTNVLGFQDAALRQHIIDQGVDDLESLGPLKDDETQTITDNIRRGVRADANGVGGMPGLNITVMETRSLKRLAYVGRHLRCRVGTPWPAANQINAGQLDSLWTFEDLEEETRDKDKQTPEKYNGITSLPAMKAGLESWPRDVRGHHGVSLGHVIRKEADPNHVDNTVNPNNPTDVKMVRKAPWLLLLS